jgi:methylated-DNA-[protein]-cysteine S-methyltransferase
MGNLFDTKANHPTMQSHIMPHALFPTAIGSCGLAWNDTGLTGFALPDADETALKRRLASRTLDHGGAIAPESAPEWVREVIIQVQRHLTGTPQDFAGARYDFRAVTEFQRRVYEFALTVKPGHTRTYGDVATALGLPPGGARSVGTALGDNPWPLLVPCHRFIAANGKMTGFSAPGGIQTKTRLLALEGAQLLSE